MSADWPIWLILLLSGITVVALGVLAVRGRLPLQPLPEAVSTVPLLELPTDRALTAPEVEGVRFETGLRGYDPGPVDAHLEEWIRWLRPAAADAEEVPARPATDVTFPVVLRGYRMEQVDEVLGRLGEGETPQGEVLGRLGEGETPQGEVLEQPRTLTDARESDGPRRESDWPDRDSDVVPSARAPREITPHADVAWRPRLDLVVLGIYLLLGLWLFRRVLVDPHGAYLSHGVHDQQMWEWFFAAGADGVRHLQNPLFSHLQNAPDGVNIMANASSLGLGLPLAPLTLLVSPQITFLLIELTGLVGTAASWYWLFCKRLGVRRVGAAVGGGFVGFAPAMVSHANGHPNWVALFLFPLIVDRVLHLADGGPRVRGALVLAALVTWQIFIAEEPLLLAAIGMAIMGVVLILQRRLDVRTLAPGLGLAALVTSALVAFPLWWQFRGPGSYSSIWHPPTGNDLAAVWSRATRSIGADPWAAAALSMNRTEENSFFGIPLLIVATAVVVLLWRRRPIVRALSALIVISIWLSLGPTVLLHGKPTPIPALWALFDDLPLLSNVVATRFAMLALPAFGALLALGIHEGNGWLRHRLSTRSRLGNSGWTSVATVVPALAVILALVPVFPTPLVADSRTPIPAFFTTGEWQQWIHGGSLVTVPPTDLRDTRGLEWQMAAGMGFNLVSGYFVGPDGSPTRTGIYGPPARPTTLWLQRTVDTKLAQPPAPDQRAQLIEDLRFWRADAVVLQADSASEQAMLLLESLRPFLGEPEVSAGVWVWDVRSLRDRP